MKQRAFLRQLSIWVMRLGFILLFIALWYKYFKPQMLEAKIESTQQCIIECNRTATANVSTARKQICLTRLDDDRQSCFAPDEIIFIELRQGKTILYDYRGRGVYISENLNQILQAVYQADRNYEYLQRVNRQEIANLRYTLQFDKCTRQLELEEEFESTVAKGKVKSVTELLHRTCSVM
ncbi:MAG: LytTR family transcriptional regulator DNA-binding domain-containing protein [Saprospiraceae bacterium]|nr:LytTR family transcriptional regulator DNA-binding domain-containing protein [Saprospiraceae bacterium]